MTLSVCEAQSCCNNLYAMYFIWTIEFRCFNKTHCHRCRKFNICDTKCTFLKGQVTAKAHDKTRKSLQQSADSRSEEFQTSSGINVSTKTMCQELHETGHHAPWSCSRMQASHHKVQVTIQITWITWVKYKSHECWQSDGRSGLARCWVNVTCVCCTNCEA